MSSTKINTIMRLAKYLGFICLWFLLACNGSDKKVKQPTTVDKTYTYSMDTSKVNIVWTAFKFTEKIRVSGTFDTIVCTANKSANSIESLLKSTKINIITNSVNSYNAIRDQKLRQTFFNTFNTDTIKGKVLDVESKNGLLALQMNNITNPTNYSYNYKNDTLYVSTKIDLIKWNGKNALDALNKECYDLHKGPDGISKLWPDVAIKIKLPVKQNTL